MKDFDQITNKERSRFWSRVEKTDSCWNWTASTNKKGYGKFGLEGISGTYLAHRFSWVLHYQSNPGKLCVLHHCDNPPCIRPDHLFLGTVPDNNADRHAKGRDGFIPHIGEANGAAKLTEAQVMEILPMAGFHKDIAAKYGVSQTLISRIKRRESWTHVRQS